jgi:HK97 gp10 family phage protein
MKDITFEGLDDIVEKLDGVLDEATVLRALGKAAALVERTAKQKAPKGDGELRRSITSKVDPEKATVYTSLEYAPYVEYGTGLYAEEAGRTDVPWSYKDEQGEWHTTSGMHPQPYMRPALNENREEIKRILREGLLNG